jgi:pimeloyl-ACP methyl ester carboxylesterase
MIVVLRLVGPALEAGGEARRGVRRHFRAEQVQRGREPEIEIALERRQIDRAGAARPARDRRSDNGRAQRRCIDRAVARRFRQAPGARAGRTRAARVRRGHVDREHRRSAPAIRDHRPARKAGAPPRRPDAAFRGWNDIWLAPAFRSWNIEACLPGVRCPLLLIQGRDDEYGSAAQLDAIERQVGGKVARLELADCRHSPHRDQPEATLAAIADFVATTAP